jgi:hypothetical protein
MAVLVGVAKDLAIIQKSQVATDVDGPIFIVAVPELSPGSVNGKVVAGYSSCDRYWANNENIIIGIRNGYGDFITPSGPSAPASARGGGMINVRAQDPDRSEQRQQDEKSDCLHDSHLQ